MRPYILLFTFLFIITSYSANAESLIHEYRLNNGLKVILKEDHRAPVVVTQVWYKVGSSYESNGMTGISHVLEHMMFKGSKKYPSGSLSKIIAENGGDENAFTSYDYTAYYQMLEASKLPITLQLEADRMRNLLLNEKDFVKEMEVIKEERRLRTDDNPQSLTYERFLAEAHVASPYHHPVIGWLSDLNNLKISEVQKWYGTWYSPNNAVLVIVGDIKPESTLELIQKYFGQLPSAVVPPTKDSREINSFGTRRIVVKAPAQLPWVIMGYNVPVLRSAVDKSEVYALDVLEGILAGGDSARIPKEIVRGKQIATEADASYDMYSRLDDLFLFSGSPSQGHTTADVEQAIAQQIQRLQTDDISEKELNRVKAQVIANKVYQKDSLMNQANEIGALEAVNLSWRDADEYVKHIQEVTPAQVREVAKKYLIPERLTIATLVPLPISSDKPVQSIDTKGDQNVR